jgi:hypothetical protein
MTALPTQRATESDGRRKTTQSFCIGQAAISLPVLKREARMIAVVGRRLLGWATAVTVAAFATLVSAAPTGPANSFVSHHATTIRGKPLAYTAVAGETILTDLAGKPTASLFSFTYLKDGPREASRPVTFVFNGGPGSSSLWLHMGVIGPRRVALDKEVNPRVTPPFGVVDNPDSILDVTDLVFIDPVGTGFSHALGDTPPESFYSVDGDAASVAQFIELWLSKNGALERPEIRHRRELWQRTSGGSASRPDGRAVLHGRDAGDHPERDRAPRHDP